MNKRKHYIRVRPDGREVIFMCAAEGYAMVRIKGYMPFVVNINVWNSWPEKAS